MSFTLRRVAPFIAALTIPGLVAVSAPAQALQAVVYPELSVTCDAQLNGAATVTLHDHPSSSAQYWVAAFYEGAGDWVILGDTPQARNFADGSTMNLFPEYGVGPNGDADSVEFDVISTATWTQVPFTVTPGGGNSFNRNPTCGERPNEAPTALPVTAVMPQYESGVTVTLHGADADGVLPSDAYSVPVQPTNGVASVVGDQLTWTPVDEAWTGTETFQYTVKDAGGLIAEASVTVTVTARTQVVVTPPVFTPGDVASGRLAALVAPSIAGVTYYLKDTTSGTEFAPFTQADLAEGHQFTWEARADGALALLGEVTGVVESPHMLRPVSNKDCYNAVCVDNQNNYPVMFGSKMVPAGVVNYRVPTKAKTLHWAVTTLDGTEVQSPGSTDVKQFRPRIKIWFSGVKRHRCAVHARVDNTASTVDVIVALSALPAYVGDWRISSRWKWNHRVNWRGKEVKVMVDYAAAPDVSPKFKRVRIPRPCK